MFSKVIWRFIMFEILLMRFLCEDCKNEHLQTQYCMNDLLLRAENMRPLKETGRQRMLFRTIYKGNKLSLNIYGSNTINVKEYSDSKLKLKVFSRGDDYFVFGSKIFTRRRVRNCLDYLCGKDEAQLEHISGKLEMERFMLTRVGAKYVTPYVEYAMHYFYESGCDCVDEISTEEYIMFCEYGYATI